MTEFANQVYEIVWSPFLVYILLGTGLYFSLRSRFVQLRMVGEMLRAGAITEEQARSHPYRNVITRALGTGAEIETDILTLEKQPGDKYLLCSDGLTEYVRCEEMQEILLRTPNEEAADRLLEMALAAGGRDNISLVIAEVTA